MNEEKIQLQNRLKEQGENLKNAQTSITEKEDKILKVIKNASA